MRLQTGLKLALNITLHSKLRSWLTVIGIVIGVAAVVAIVSIGAGLQQNVQSRLSGVGEDLITLSPGGRGASSGFRGGGEGGGATSASNLTVKDIRVMQSINNVKFVEGLVTGRAETYYLGEKTTLSVNGVDPLVWQYMVTSELASGRLLGPADSNVIVIGSRIANQTFKEPLYLGRSLELEGKPFKIIGILKESAGLGGGDDGTVFMPVHSARSTLTTADNQTFNSIVVKVTDVSAITQVMADADAKLALSRHTSNLKKDYSLRSAQAQAQRLSDITSTMTLFLGAIAAVSLIVGAIGIANTMFTAVLEKTKEIGIMKAIGAKNRDILIVFMLNSAMVGLVGGLLGVSLGALASKLIPSLGVSLFLPGGGAMTTVISPTLIIGSLALSVGIGIISGVIPAYRASKLKPVDALRY